MNTSSLAIWLATRLGVGGMVGLCVVPMIVFEGYALARILEGQPAAPVYSAPILTPAPIEIPTTTPEPSTPPPPAVPATISPVRTGARTVIAETYHAAEQDTYTRYLEGRRSRGW